MRRAGTFTLRQWRCWPTVAALFGAGLALASLARAAEPPSNPFDGQWSLEYVVATKPGGETQRAGTLTLSPVNLQFQVTRGEFRVGEDGRFHWMERTSGSWHSDTIATDDAGQRSISVQDTEPLLLADGTVSLVAGATGPQKQLKVKFQWSHGSGMFIGGYGTATGTLSVSADGQTLTITSDRGTVALPHKHLSTEWDLRPTSVQREQQGPDVIREVVTFKVHRQSTLGEWGSGPLPVVERLEVKQVRDMKLVRRG